MKKKHSCISILVVGFLCFMLGAATQSSKEDSIDRETVTAAEKIIGLDFTDGEIDMMLPSLQSNLDKYNRIRKANIDNSIPPAFFFNPIPVGMKFDAKQEKLIFSPPRLNYRPDDPNELAFYSVRDLSELIKNRELTSYDLTAIYLDRLKEYGPKLKCVITIVEELALKQAQKVDEEISQGIYRGPLHGIPYGVKDLLAVKGYKTTWGAAPYKDRVIDENAAVVKRLEEAGAVLIAKLTLGALAMGDWWYGGQTKNPWNLEQGSSGSSAGSSAATAAGLVAFSIGSETWGSIGSPSARCGVTGLRPTFGRVSRSGAMALSWTMDKIGPICRSAEDCAIVLNAILGPDGVDPTVADLPFNYNPQMVCGGKNRSGLACLRGSGIIGRFSALCSREQRWR